jgi:hypothetical protein
MREFLLGGLGAGLTYAVLWYQLTPGVDVVLTHPAPPVQVAGVATRKARASLPAAHEQGPASHVPAADSRGEGALLDGRRQPGAHVLGAEDAFIGPLPAALPKTMERMAELQRISADPNALAARVQAMETDEAELAELKAFAERFVALPPDRVERQIPGTSRSSGSNDRRSPRTR